MKILIHETFIRIPFIQSYFMQTIDFFSFRRLLSIYASISLTTFQSGTCISLSRLSDSIRMKYYFPKNGIGRKGVTAAFSVLFCVISFDLKMQMGSYLFWFQKILDINCLKNHTFSCIFSMFSRNVNKYLNKCQIMVRQSDVSLRIFEKRATKE